MSERELYQKKKRAQLDEWRADVQKFKAKVSGASADAQLDLNKRIQMLELKIEESQLSLSQLAAASENGWKSIKDGVESAWDSMKSAVSDTAAKFKG